MATTLLLNTGRAKITGRIKGSDANEPAYVGVGSGAGTTQVTDTSLFTEFGSRILGTTSLVTGVVTNDTYQIVALFTASGATSYTNAGANDAASSGNWFIKGDFDQVDLADGEKLEITITIRF